MKKSVLILFISLIGITGMHAQTPTYVGIPTSQFNYYAAAQTSSNWCWAASIQMIMNYYGVNINQSQIVYQSYGVSPNGNLPNWTGSLQVITANLNYNGVDANGRQFSVRSSLYQGAPTPAYLIQELQAQRPVLIGYRSSPSSGHAVVITAVSYINTSNGPQIQSIVVRDPFSTQSNINTSGRVEYTGINLASLMDSHWYIRVF